MEREQIMKMLDCFCGMGGVSDGFAKEGFKVTGIDIVNAPEMLGYKHNFIQADIKELDGKDFQGYDVIWGSPPCRNFTSIARIARNWKEPCDPKKGLELVNAYLNFKNKAKPNFWIMENVPGLANHLPFKPEMKAQIKPNMWRVFYGNFPAFLMPRYEKFVPVEKQSPRAIRSWKSAKIPLPCSKAFARACKRALTVRDEKENLSV